MISPMVALGIRKLSPPASLLSSDGGSVWLWLREPVRRSCVPSAVKRLRYDHFSAIRSVFDAPLLACLARDGGGSGEYNSILITLVRAALHPLFLPR